jgi:eukaryotic-like serine/threonine-protein kinase
MREPPIAIGATVADKYVVERVLGEGGMGVVLAARHRELDQRVAIKCLLPEIAQRGVAAERFRREARAVASMRSEHICRVLDVGTLPDGIPFMIMEYLDGCDLAQELERRERIPYKEAVAYLLQACEALTEAHAAGIIHRDLKPANLFLEQRSSGARRVKVLDFGVSKSLLEAQKSHQALTQTANLVGSPLYMSPEQLESSRDVDARADIWGLGVVLYELISGQPPFAAGNIPQLIAAVINERPRRLLNELKVPAELETVIMRTLSKDRRDRPASVEELMDELEPFAAPPPAAGYRTTQLSASDRSAGAGSGGGTLGVRSPTRTSQTPLAWDRHDKAPKSGRKLAVGIVLVALAAAAGFFVYTSQRAQEPGIAKPLSQDAKLIEPAAAAVSATPEIPQGALPDTSAVTANPPKSEPATAEQPKAPVVTTTTTTTTPSPVPAKPIALPAAPAPVQTAVPVPAAPTAVKPVAPAQPSHGPGAPPRGQISDFGGRR